MKPRAWIAAAFFAVVTGGCGSETTEPIDPVVRPGTPPLGQSGPATVVAAEGRASSANFTGRFRVASSVGGGRASSPAHEAFGVRPANESK